MTIRNAFIAILLPLCLIFLLVLQAAAAAGLVIEGEDKALSITDDGRRLVLDLSELSGHTSSSSKSSPPQKFILHLTLLRSTAAAQLPPPTLLSSSSLFSSYSSPLSTLLDESYSFICLDCDCSSIQLDGTLYPSSQPVAVELAPADAKLYISLLNTPLLTVTSSDSIVVEVVLSTIQNDDQLQQDRIECNMRSSSPSSCINIEKKIIKSCSVVVVANRLYRIIHEPGGKSDSDYETGEGEGQVSVPHTSLPSNLLTSISSSHTPKPVHITCLTIGTRGDVQPYVALCLRLMKDGHKCRIATHREYKSWIESYGIEFGQVLGDPAELMKLCAENGMFTISFFRKALHGFSTWITELLESAWTASQGTDMIIESPSAVAGLHIAEKLGVPYFSAFPFPWHQTSVYAAPLVAPKHKHGATYNLWTYKVLEHIFRNFYTPYINSWRENTLEMPRKRKYRFTKTELPVIYSFSPTIVPRAQDWASTIHPTGYWFLDQSEGTSWTPPADLLAFISNGVPTVYIGFGSVIVEDAEEMTRTIVKAVKDAGIQAILAKGWSDRKIVKDTSHSPPTENKQNGNDTAAVTPSTHSLLVSLPRHARKKLRFDPSAPKPLPSFIYPLKSVPHDWLFPRIAGVVHHGGAGTTAAGLRAGVPTIIKPFFGDQNFWAERVESLGVGLSMQTLCPKTLAAALTRITTDKTMIEKAADIGVQIRSENGVDRAVESIYDEMEYSRRTVIMSRFAEKTG